MLVVQNKQSVFITIITVTVHNGFLSQCILNHKDSVSKDVK